MLTQTTIKTARSVAEALTKAHQDGLFISTQRPLWMALVAPEMEGPAFVFFVVDMNEGTFGIEILHGRNAEAATAQRILLSSRRIELSDEVVEIMDSTNTMTAILTPLENVPARLRQIVEALGFRGRRETIVPELVCRPAEREEREMRPPELRVCLTVVRALAGAFSDGSLARFKDLAVENMVRMTVEGPPDNLAVAFDEIPFSLPLHDDEGEMPDGDPATADHSTWREVGKESHGWVAAVAAAMIAEDPELVDPFFENSEDAEEIFEELEDYLPSEAVLNWLAIDPDPDGLTIIDERRKIATSRLEIEYLDGWSKSVLSFFRVDQVVPESRIEIVDVIDGRRHIVHDRALSNSVRPNFVIVGWVFNVRGHGYIQVGGPVLSPFDYDQTLRDLSEMDGEMTHEYLRDHPEVLGMLYENLLDRMSSPALPQMQNSDGDPMSLMSAIFSVDDPDRLTKALEDAEDFDFDKGNDKYIWIRPSQGKNSTFGTVLGSMQLIGNELIADLNSENRVARLRERLEKIPGVRYLRSTPYDRDSAQKPGDNRLPKEPIRWTKDVIAQVTQALEAQMMSWLDTPIPAFGGQTPREHAKTAKGRAAVKKMILGMPDPLNQDGVRIAAPRERMLEELGLD